MAIQELAPGGDRFKASNSTVIGNNASGCNDPCSPNEDWSTVVRNGSCDITHTSDLSIQDTYVSKVCHTKTKAMCVTLAAKSSSLISMWQLATWGSARCVERCAIHQEALSRLRFGEGQGWRTFTPYLSKYRKSQGTILFGPTPHPH